jgi:hypothetical protein
MLDTELTLEQIPEKVPSTLMPLQNLLLRIAERRAFKGREKGSISHCKVCGLPNSKNDERVNGACHTHSRASKEKWLEGIQKIEKDLRTSTLDMLERQEFNAQVVKYAEMLLIARDEHEKYQAETELAREEGLIAPVKRVSAPAAINEHAVMLKIREVLSLLDAKADAEKDPIKLLDYVMGNIRLLQAK